MIRAILTFIIILYIIQIKRSFYMSLLGLNFIICVLFTFFRFTINPLICFLQDLLIKILTGIEFNHQFFLVSYLQK